MIARGFKPGARVAAIGTAALGCYMLSLNVAAERAELAKLDGVVEAAGTSQRRVEAIVVRDGKVAGVYDMSNPDKLGHVPFPEAP